MTSEKPRVAEPDICAWCVDYLVTTLKLPARWVVPEVKFTRMGMDSAMAVYLQMALEEWLEIELPPELLFEQETIAEVASYIVRSQGRDSAAAGLAA
jgi:acyl carrier protein